MFMNLQYLNKVCCSTCIVCIVVGTILSLAMIWGSIDSIAFFWKSWLSVGVLFLASALTLAVSKTLGGPPMAAKNRDEQADVRRG